MKKVGFGTRPSELKSRKKKIDFEDEGPVRLAEKRNVHKNTGGSPSNIFIAVAVAGGVILAAVFFFGGFSLNVSLDRVEFVSAGNKLTVKAGESFKVSYADGLVFKRAVMKGIYRVFPPDDILLRIDGNEKEVAEDEDMTLILKPENRTGYKVIISRKGAEIGKLSFSLLMDSNGWIRRADAAEDNNVRKNCYKKAVSLDPDSENAHVALGRLYESEKKLTSASSEYEAVIKINPNNIMALKSLAELYKKRGIKKRLVYIYEKLGNADTSNADDYFYQAGILAEKHISRSRALTLFRKALGANRKHIEARQHLIRIYEHDKQWKRAAANTKVLIEFDPKNPDLYLYLSDLYLKLNSKKQAAEYAKKAEKLKPGSAAICLQLAIIYEKSKDYDKAIKYYGKSIKLDRKNDAAHNNLGLLLEKKGKIKEAVKHYKRAAALKPGSTDYLINLADAYEKAGKWANAVRTYEKVVKIDKKNKGAWEAIASISYDKLKNKWKVLEAYLALSKIEPRKIVWHAKAAAVYEQMGKFSKAKKEYEAILKIDPNNKTARKRYVEISKMKAIKDSI